MPGFMDGCMEQWRGGWNVNELMPGLLDGIGWILLHCRHWDVHPSHSIDRKREIESYCIWSHFWCNRLLTSPIVYPAVPGHVCPRQMSSLNINNQFLGRIKGDRPREKGSGGFIQITHMPRVSGVDNCIIGIGATCQSWDCDIESPTATNHVSQHPCDKLLSQEHFLLYSRLWLTKS